MATLLGRNLFLYVGGNKLGKELSHTFSRDFNFLEKRGLFVDRQIIMTDKAGDVSLSFILDYDASNSYKTLVSSAESQALLTFTIKTGVSGDPEITFQGNIIQYRQQADLDSVMRVEVSIVINGPVQVLVGGAYKIKSTNIDEISVYSLEEGSVPYTIRNTVTGITTSGTLTFAAPAIIGGIADGYFSDAITGLASGTKYELTVGLGIAQTIWTQFNFSVLAADQHLFSSAAPDYLTETDIGVWGLPKTVNQVELGGVANDFSGNANNGAVKNSPCASVLVAATLTFSNTAPYTRPAAVTIGAGTATASGYDSGTGVLTIDGAGTIEYLVVDGINIYLCSNAGNFLKWTQNSISYGITFSAVTWATTTNNNAFLQAKGGTKHKILTGTSNQITYASTLTLSETVNNTFKFRSRVGWYGRTGVQARLPLTSNGGTGASARSNIFLDNATSVDPTEVTRTRLNIFLRSSVSFSLFSTPFTAEDSVSNFDLIEITLTLNTSDLVNTSITYKIDNLTTGVTILAETTTTHDFSAVTAASDYADFTKSGLYPNDGTKFDRCIEYIEINNGTDTVIYDVTTGTSTGTIGISSDQTEDFYLPTVLDSSGNSTGFDVFGSALPEGYGNRFFDFTESLEWKATPVTETYGDLPPPVVGVTEYGAEFVTNPNAKSDIISIPAGAGASLDAEILKYLAAIQSDSLPKIIKRA
jgi:hypothetical protein